MSQFKKFIEAGKNSADQVSNNFKNINYIFEELNKELAEETEGKISLKKVIFNPDSGLAYFAKIMTPPTKPSVSLKSTEMGTLDVCYLNESHASLAKWEQHPDGYPFTIEFLGERTDCWDVDSLVRALARIISSGQFWLKVKELESKFKASKNNKDTDN